MKHIAIFLIRMYQSLQASFYVGSCRFHPTCSHYAVEAFESRGFFMGLILTLFRLVRCQPFCKGGWDPVPRDPVSRDPVPRDPDTGNGVPGKSVHGNLVKISLASRSQNILTLSKYFQARKTLGATFE